MADGIGADGKILKGWKRCPHADCGAMIRGPRTATCGKCKRDVSKNKNKAKAKIAAVKASAKVATESVPVVEVIPDPFTFSLTANLSGERPPNSTAVAKASGVINTPVRTRKTLAYALGVQAPVPADFPNIVETA